eukprot:SAG25_NODE_1900_length_2169_cov_1.714010_2_plen_67_part_00
MLHVWYVCWAAAAGGDPVDPLVRPPPTPARMKTLRQENEQLKEELARMHEDMLDLQRQLAEIPEEA